MRVPGSLCKREPFKPEREWVSVRPRRKVRWMLKYWLLAGTALLLSLVLTPVVASWAQRLGAVGDAGTWRAPRRRVPRLGGLAVLGAFAGALCAGFLADRLAFEVFWGEPWPWGWLLGGALVVVACGVIDDLWSLGPLSKLAFQLIAGIMVLAAGRGIDLITNPYSGQVFALGWLGVPVTLLWVVGITNAFNLIDGLDGLAVGVGVIACGTLFAVSLRVGHVEVSLLAITLAGALAGFLYYNFNPAMVFLGDSGSLLLGYLLSVLSIQAAQKGATVLVIAVPILALGLPIMDTLLAMVRRTLGALHVVRLDEENREYRFAFGSTSILRADRDHIHHRLLRLGLTHRRAVLVLYVVCLVLSALSFLAVHARASDTALLVAVVAAASYLGVRKLGYAEVEVLRRGTLLPLFELPMFNRRLVHAVVDAGFIGAAFLAGNVLLYGGRIPLALHRYFVLSTVIAVAAKVAVFAYSGLYRRAYRHVNAGDLIGVVRSLLLAELVAAIGIGVLAGVPSRPGLLLVLDFYFTATLVLGARLAFTVLEVMARGWGGAAARPVVIYGAGSAGASLLRELEQNPELACRPVAFIDDSPRLWGRRLNGVPVVGGTPQLAEVLWRQQVYEVIISTPKIALPRIEEVAAICGANNVKLRRFRIALEQVDTPAAAPLPRAEPAG